MILLITIPRSRALLHHLFEIFHVFGFRAFDHGMNDQWASPSILAWWNIFAGHDRNPGARPIPVFMFIDTIIADGKMGEDDIVVTIGSACDQFLEGDFFGNFLGIVGKLLFGTSIENEQKCLL